MASRYAEVDLGPELGTVVTHTRELFLHFGSCSLAAKLISFTLNLNVLLSVMA